LVRRPAEALPKDDAVRRELYFFGLYRVLEAALLALIFFGPESTLFGTPRHPVTGDAVTLFYFPASLVLLLWARQGNALRWHVLVGTAIDIGVATLAAHALPAAAPGIAMMLLFNIGAAALLLPLRYGLGAAILASVALLGEYIWNRAVDPTAARPLAEKLMFSISYCAFAVLTWLLGRQMREQQALAVRRGVEVADMAALNELIIRRMRTGVLLVDANRRIRMANEAALLLLGRPGEDMRERDLTEVAPTLAERLDRWRREHDADQAPLPLGDEQIEVLPRFVQLMATSQSVLLFLDDASQVSRRAESLTLATMGRFAASLAHEIRNPLAAINYATQLLEESRDIGEADRRLLQIVHQQCMRTNGIVESVLGLARRERAHPEHVELGHFVRRFIEDYRQVLPEDNGSLKVNAPGTPVPAMIDPRHLQQVLTVLVQNALTHGRMPGEAARVTLSVHVLAGAPAIDVLDRGPGIAAGVLAQLFRPFFTTSEQGTGLGLYIARELCHANQASLDYVGAAGGGGCFRITLAATQGLLAD
jgi:two-component system sensor histidine kinase PilS (NtrC family)